MTEATIDFRQMTRRERIGGILYIPVHSFLLPFALVLLDEFVLPPNGVFKGELIPNLLIYAIGFVFCLLFMWKYLKKSFTDIFEKNVKFIRRLIGGLILLYVLSIVSSTVVTLILGDVGQIENPNSVDINRLVLENFNIMAVTSIIFAPIVEECIFRGALFGTIRKKSRFWAYFVTIVIFGFYHLYGYFISEYSWKLWVYLLQYAAPTIALCRVYEKSGSIWCPIALHAINNYIALNAVRYM